MQTFLPYPDFAQSAQCLDDRRLNKQRVECKQILKALLIDTYGWQHHPAVNMWREHGGALVRYAFAIHRECGRRGIADRKCIAEWFQLALAHFGNSDDPPWLGDKAFHRSHQSNLRRKSAELYPFDVPDDLPYVWPTNRGA